MGDKVIFYQNPFYDDVFIIFDTTVPSKRIRYKQNENKIITEIITPKGSKVFEEFIKNNLERNPNWPHKGRLLVAVQIMIKASDYKNKDIDNVTKSILDALKGIVFEDDVQIDMIHIQKIKSDKYSFAVGVKVLDEDDSALYFPPLFSEKEFEYEQTYTFIAKSK
ncbi:MAG: hypothetical protein A3K31_17005 [Ignavibacteria bacterium RIFOXYA12_FULL_35_25]|nr:MAG: hypothetical protein A2058_13745 [Ignavibacteria bacterium GWA2_36_19]OGU62831.1 MAG: hypothetical protein A2X60_04630 [Ignavibacteria bacterium GWF2_35_20]OGU86834.1 MAG: hypothetical protein A3K31_17005 [Ignavibacteria bacterium RIFOXYA12_FULL_35_25]OGV29954.1 MAG: hypothetical protein A2523_00995 [Ignavibacteria bacterium RIFOXYD12_FULL_36_8]